MIVPSPSPSLRYPSVPLSAEAAPERCFTAYCHWLARQPLAANTRRAYQTQVRQYCASLVTTPAEFGDPLRESHARDYAVRDYKLLLKTARHARPTTVNLVLAALDSFYQFLGLGRPNVRREDLPQQAPQALAPDEQKRFLRAVERSTAAQAVRNQALACLFLYTALRLHECARLNVEDVRLSARKGLVIVRSGKGDAYREVPLNAQARDALHAWLRVRAQAFPTTAEPALFLSRHGRRLATRTVDFLLRQLSREAGLALSAHTLRHTCLTTLVRQGNDLVLVAEIAGHKRLETTRRYSLPSAQDRAAAMDALQVDY